ncbi:hypothetical protein VN0798_04260 [Helicobacter pylori]
MRLKKYSPVPKRYKFLQIVNEAEATSLARQYAQIQSKRQLLFWW